MARIRNSNQDYLIPSIFPIFKLHLNYNNKFKQSFFRATITSFYLNHIRIYVQYIYLSLYFSRDSILISCLSSIKIFAPRKKKNLLIASELHKASANLFASSASACYHKPLRYEFLFLFLLLVQRNETVFKMNENLFLLFFIF